MSQPQLFSIRFSRPNESVSARGLSIQIRRARLQPILTTSGRPQDLWEEVAS